VIGNEKKLVFDNIDVEVVPLPGHSPNQIGIAVEGVLFCADAIFSKEVLAKYKIPFHVDIAKQKETLEFLMDCGYRYFIPSHAELTEDIADLAYANLRLIENIENNVLEILKDRKTTECVLKELCNCYGIKIRSCQQFYLLKTATMAYLSSLHRCGKLKIAIAENTLYWHSV
jgi:glyoxylase-like metal-dependent hydrolase (beta-lactamase superfamily II)